MSRRQLAIGLVGVAAAALPRRGLEALPTICPVRLVTGYPCPTCGMTRSWHSVARLDPLQALRDHPFGPLVLTVLLVGASSPSRGIVLAARVDRLPSRVKAGALVAWLGWWVSQLAATHRRR